MLFDLRGRRRRAVQVTYLTLAVLMGGGLVLFGIGGDVSGGLFDAISGKGSGSDGDIAPAVEKRIDRNVKRLRTDPQNTALLKELVRDEFQLATAQTQQGAQGFPKEARDELQKAGSYWQRYLDAEKGKPDADLARYALQIYDPTALNKPKDAQRAATIVAEAENDAASYLNVVQYAALAGDKRTADLAAKKAVDLAPKSQRKAVKQQAELFKNPQSAQPQG
jgi:hypothetical protein